MDAVARAYNDLGARAGCAALNWTMSVFNHQCGSLLNPGARLRIAGRIPDNLADTQGELERWSNLLHVRQLFDLSPIHSTGALDIDTHLFDGKFEIQLHPPIRASH
ncbi:hypothetical protein [Amycolatopsis sp. GM8]|uniref:hypothetical protein n=1 Tax=Amycolatopsis sp. GM8 TaxID=2896530 RepID=UPI001F3A783D|nr:hypothetical protein [Amycolatopsis sp. GM8]